MKVHVPCEYHFLLYYLKYYNLIQLLQRIAYSPADLLLFKYTILFEKSHMATQIFAILHHFCKPLIVSPLQLHNNTISLHHIYPNFSTQNSLKIPHNDNKRRFVNIKVSNLRLLLLWSDGNEAKR
jgi:hypothetical protein